MANSLRLACVLRNTFAASSRWVPHGAAATLPVFYAAARGMASSKLFVGGLAFATDEGSLRDAFSVHGEVTEVKVIVDRETGRSRGFGFVSFFSEGEAEIALQKMDGQLLNGRIMRVSHAINKPREGMGGGFQRGFNQGYGPGDNAFTPSGFGRSPNGYGQGGPSRYRQDSYSGGMGPSSYDAGRFQSARGDPSQSITNSGWNDAWEDIASKPTPPKKPFHHDETGFNWDDIGRKDPTSTNDVSYGSSAGFTSAVSEKNDGNFSLGNLDGIGTKPSETSGGNSDDYKRSNPDSATKSIPSKQDLYDEQSNPSKDDGWNDIFGEISTATDETPTGSSGTFPSSGTKKRD